ncbi:hypothetical protein BLOT_000158 [Blomia tropicalis]|nr:hypothetical protein BLOT_000158 [Blomia tropicalis]
MYNNQARFKIKKPKRIECNLDYQSLDMSKRIFQCEFEHLSFILIIYYSIIARKNLGHFFLMDIGRNTSASLGLNSLVNNIYRNWVESTTLPKLRHFRVVCTHLSYDMRNTFFKIVTVDGTRLDKLNISVISYMLYLNVKSKLNKYNKIGQIGRRTMSIRKCDSMSVVLAFWFILTFYTNNLTNYTNISTNTLINHRLYGSNLIGGLRDVSAPAFSKITNLVVFTIYLAIRNVLPILFHFMGIEPLK